MTNFQKAAGDQGKAFEDIVRTVLTVSGAQIVDQNWKDPATLEQVDFVARTSSGVEFWVEAKGSWQGRTKGLERSDTTKKAVANGWHLTYVHGEDRPPYVLITSHLPKPGTVAAREIEDAEHAGLFSAVILADDLKATVAAIDAGTLT
jgi:Holliday junction resolvase-like predicted endonuclease